MPVARQKVIDQEDQGQKIEDEDLGGEDHGFSLDDSICPYGPVNRV